MRRLWLGVVLAVGLPAGSAQAQDLADLDIEVVDQTLLAGFFGAWEIRNEAGDKRCRVVLKREPVIGGSEIEVDPGCAKVFPVMDEIAAWRLKEGWAIDLVDAVRQMRLRFEVPDVTYVAVQDIDGIFTIQQLPKQ